MNIWAETVNPQILDISTQHLEVTLGFGTTGKHVSHLRRESDVLGQSEEPTGPL